MEKLFINTENNKMNELHKSVLNLPQVKIRQVKTVKVILKKLK